MLSEILAKVFIRATISELFKFNLLHLLFDSNANKIFSPVPIPSVCIFPHNLHFSHIIQFIIKETLRNLCRNSFTISGFVLFKNEVFLLKKVLKIKLI